MALVTRHVLLHGGLPREALRADGAHERLLVAVVRPLMGLEVHPTREGLVALRALNLAIGQLLPQREVILKQVRISTICQSPLRRVVRSCIHGALEYVLSVVP